jgi:hypothetical protein
LVRIVKANEQIPAKGKCFCPLAEAEEQVQQHLAEHEEGLPEDDGEEAAAGLPDGGQWDDPVLPPRGEGPLPQPQEQPPPGTVAVEEEEEKEEKEEKQEKEEVFEMPPPVPAQAPQGADSSLSPTTNEHTSSYPTRRRNQVSKFQ